MGLTIALAQATLDALFPVSGATDYIGYSTNGTTEWANLARTAIGATGWAPATATDPAIKANNTVLTSATVTTTGGTITHYAIYTAPSGGTIRSDWQPLDNPRALSVGDSTQWATGACKIAMT